MIVTPAIKKRLLQIPIIFCILLTFPAASGTVSGDNGKHPGQEAGYIGATLTDNDAGQTVFSWIRPGPLDGRGLRSRRFDLQRPDILVSLDGKHMSAGKAEDYIRSRPPGSQLTIKYRHAARRGSGVIPPEVETTGDTKTIVVTVAELRKFTGTIGMPRLSCRDWMPPPEDGRILAPMNSSNILGKAIEDNDLADQVETLKGVFKDFVERTTDAHMLSRVRAGFLNPFALPELEREITEDARTLRSDFFFNSLRMAANNLDVGAPEKQTLDEAEEHDNGILAPRHMAGLRAMIEEATRALGPLWENAEFARKAIGLLRVPLRTFYISGPDSADHLSVIRASADVDFEQLLGAMAHGNGFVAENWNFDPDTPHVAPPPELADAVCGRIMAARHYDGIGWIVLGGFGDNRYDMSRISVVIEPGGNDEYYMSDLALGVRVIVDLDGDDIYRGHPDQGVGGALLGLWLIDDRAGNDLHEGPILSGGAACFGVSMLINRAGNNRFLGGEWSQGAACYGAGMLLSTGRGSDVYEAEFLSQGAGGPRGFGLLFDRAGRDLYRANGPHGSSYGTPAVFKSFSQGIGFGYRGYAAGGIGMLCDMSGNDRYEAGEFSQGGGYYYALGILYDAAGNDLYYGNRYGQGFGVHQAMGILADDAGNDTYWAMGPANQGAAWDIGVGLLIDRGGDDTYRCDGFGQGAASMQGIGLLLNFGGQNHYMAGKGATQGESGRNSYHYRSTGAFSFSLLMNISEEKSFYSRGRAHNAVTKTGALDEENPENSRAWGLVIDGHDKRSFFFDANGL